VRDGEVVFADNTNDQSLNWGLLMTDYGQSNYSYQNYGNIHLVAGGESTDTHIFEWDYYEPTSIRLHYGKKLFGTPRLDFQLWHYWDDGDFASTESGFSFYANNTIDHHDGRFFYNASNHYEWI
jgi:hypothetical protein